MICDVCGNETDAGDSACRFCDSPLEPGPDTLKSDDVAHRIVNIERGRPLVETALRKMDNELERARTERVRVVTLIHGYGSSGKGGKIRTECRKVLDYQLQQQKINAVIPGETFRKRNGSGKALMQRYPQLERICTADFANPGITIVVLR